LRLCARGCKGDTDQTLFLPCPFLDDRVLFCRYSNVLPDTGLHPRPSHAPELQPLFPKTKLEPTWESTVYASKRGESLSELLARAELVSFRCTGGLIAWIGDRDEGRRLILIVVRGAWCVVRARIVCGCFSEEGGG